MIHSPYPEFDCNINYHVNNIISTGKYKIIQIKAPMSHKKTKDGDGERSKTRDRPQCAAKNKKSRRMIRWLFHQSEQGLLVGFVPDFFFDESGQVAAVFGFAFESVADAAAFGVGNAFGDLGGHRFFVLDIIESVIHFLFLLGFFVNTNKNLSRNI